MFRLGRRRGWAALAAAAAVVAAAHASTATGAPAPPNALHPPRVPPDTFGMDVQHVALLTDASTRAAHLATLSAGGITSVRSDLLWNVAEDATAFDRSYDWGAGAPEDYDRWVADLARHGIRWAPTLNGSVAWARPPGCDHTCSPVPAMFEEWATFAAEAVLRYGRGGTFWAAHPELPHLPPATWEVWNEPNLGWGTRCNTHVPGVDPAPREYALFFARTRVAVNEVDPAASVLVGGLADVVPTGNQCSAREFALGMHAQDPTVFTDAGGVGLHEYVPTPRQVRAGVEAFRLLLDAELSAPDVPIHLNEVGWGTEPGSLLVVSETTRGEYLAEVADTLARSRCGVRSISPYAWLTPERDPPVDPFDWFGIGDADGTAKPSGQRYLDEVALLQGAGPVPPDPSVFEHADGEPPRCEWRAATAFDTSRRRHPVPRGQP